MKKLILLGLMLATFVASAANFKVQPLFNGWNLYVTNGTVYQVGGTNYEYTTLQGTIVYSLTNNLGNTNSVWPDVFDAATYIASDYNGNLNTNAQFTIYINNTNWIPVAITNSQGQYFVSNSWPLLTSQYPTYMYPANTNLYPSLPNASNTNMLVFNFQRGITVIPGTAGTGPSAVTLWETSTNSLAKGYVSTGASPQSFTFSPPADWMAGWDKFRLNSVYSSNAVAVGSGFIINGAWFSQWNP